MDKASTYGAGDCRFESCRGHVVKKYKVVFGRQAAPDEIMVSPKGRSIEAVRSCSAQPSKGLTECGHRCLFTGRAKLRFGVNV